jgi:hypothetical protein
MSLGLSSQHIRSLKEGNKEKEREKTNSKQAAVGARIARCQSTSLKKKPTSSKRLQGRGVTLLVCHP